MTREEAIYEISTSGDPQEYEKAINFAIEALKNDVPRETINAMISDILKFKNVVEKHECIEFSKSYAAGMQQVLEIIYKFTYNGGENVKT